MFHKKEYNKNIKLFDNKTKYFYDNKEKRRECFHSLLSISIIYLQLSSITF